MDAKKAPAALTRPRWRAFIAASLLLNIVAAFLFLQRTTFCFQNRVRINAEASVVLSTLRSDPTLLAGAHELVRSAVVQRRQRIDSRRGQGAATIVVHMKVEEGLPTNAIGLTNRYNALTHVVAFPAKDADDASDVAATSPPQALSFALTTSVPYFLPQVNLTFRIVPLVDNEEEISQVSTSELSTSLSSSSLSSEKSVSASTTVKPQPLAPQHRACVLEEDATMVEAPWAMRLAVREIAAVHARMLRTVALRIEEAISTVASDGGVDGT